MAQMKEQIKTPEKELNKMEISNLSDAEFKTLVLSLIHISEPTRPPVASRMPSSA